MSQQRISSVQRFKQLTQELQREVRKDAIVELNAAADELVEQMRSAAPQGPTGNLKRSIRKEPGKRDTVVRILAGGPLTTVEARKGSGAPYDYSRAVEFGTQQAPAHPFFFPSYRLRRKTIRAKLKRKITADIKRRSAG